MVDDLNRRAFQQIEQVLQAEAALGVVQHRLPNAARVVDFGVRATAGLDAGAALATICMSGLGQVALYPGQLAGRLWPTVQVTTDWPLEACLLSQYAGWKIARDGYFGMGSGPMRLAAAAEDLFERLQFRDQTQHCVGVLEAAELPPESVVEHIAERTGASLAQTVVCVAPTASQAGNVQIVARSVETAMHKLFELEFDVARVVSGWGCAPLPPLAADDLHGIGRTNDAILYGSRVMLWVRGDDASLQAVGQQVPACTSACYGKPFLEIFEDAGRDFYEIDPHLFSPAELVMINVETGCTHQFGRLDADVLQASFGID